MAKPETSEQQQSYFYVVWPEERSPAAGATASSTPNLIAMSAAGPSGGGAPVETFLTPNSASPPGYSGQGTHPSTSASSFGPLIGATGHSPSSSATGAGTAAALSGTDDSDSSAAGSPETTNTSQTASTAIVAAAAQTITVTDSGEFSGGLVNTSTTPHNVLISPRSHAFGLAANGSGTITTVYNPVSSPGLLYVSDASSMLSSRSTAVVPASHSAHHVGHHHHLQASGHHTAAPGNRGNGSSIAGPSLQENPRKQRHSHPSSTEIPPLRSIGMSVMQ